MTEEEMEKLAMIFAKTLQQARSVSDSEHFDHHRWISERIKHDQYRAIFWEKLCEHLAAWGAVAVITVVFYALWLYLRHLILNGTP